MASENNLPPGFQEHARVRAGRGAHEDTKVSRFVPIPGADEIKSVELLNSEYLAAVVEACCFRRDSRAFAKKTCCRNKRQQEEPPVGLEAGSQLKSQGKWPGVGGNLLWDFT